MSQVIAIIIIIIIIICCYADDISLSTTSIAKKGED